MEESSIKLQKLLLAYHHLDISVYDESYLQKALMSRLLAGHYSSPDIYFATIAHDLDEVNALITSLDNSYSEFFRNQIAFYHLEQHILPRILDKKTSDGSSEIRIWSAACARGEETYSMAILTSEITQAMKKNITCRLFGTDKNPENLIFARKGTFHASALNNVTLKRIMTCFTHKVDEYTIRPQFRECIDFSEFNLLDDRAYCPAASVYGNFDLVICSNILIYYKPHYRNFILSKIRKSLAKEAFIVTDLSERSILKENGFRELYENSGIFITNFH
jgi:chemotaxis protein methyltransferase CheR